MKNHKAFGMAKGLAIVALVIMLSAPAIATSHCPCGRLGQPGTLLRVEAVNGTATGITLYFDKPPELDKIFAFWAIKTIDNGDSVPVNGLKVTLKLDSELISTNMTDQSGYVEFFLADRGRYEITGGDANITFSLPPNLKPIGDNTTVQNNSEGVTRNTNTSGTGNTTTPATRPAQEGNADDTSERVRQGGILSGNGKGAAPVKETDVVSNSGAAVRVLKRGDVQVPSGDNTGAYAVAAVVALAGTALFLRRRNVAKLSRV